MAAPAGPCEWCGGPQVWTIIAGEVYVACEGGCLPLPLEGLAPPLDSELCAISEFDPDMELFRGGGVAPCEGADSKESEDDDLPF